MKIDRDWVKEHGTARGAWNAEMLSLLGVPWPPKKGWLMDFQPIDLSDEQVDAYHRLRAMKSRADRKRLLRGEPTQGRLL